MLTLPNKQGYGGSNSTICDRPMFELNDMCTIERWQDTGRKTFSVREIVQASSAAPAPNILLGDEAMRSKAW